MNKILPFPIPPLQPQNKVKARLYNVYQHDKLVYGSATFAQCTRFMALQVCDPAETVTLAEVFKHGYTVKAVAVA